MKRQIFWSALALAVLAYGSAAAQAHKYGVKSGSVTFESETVMGKMKLNASYVLWFDDYGMKEAKETMENGVVTEVRFSDGATIYSVIPPKRTAFKAGVASRGIEYRVDWAEVPAKDKQAGKAKQLPARTIAGKECQSYEVTSGDAVSTFAGWQGVMLFHELKRPNMTVTAKATKFDEKATVSASRFAVPAGFTVK
jgi:hypothetical protein